MAVLTSYFDESGVHGEDVCVVAGFVGNNSQWGALARDWIEAIKPAKNIHMTKLRWKRHPDAVAKRLASLGPIPHKYNLRPIMAGLNWRDYNNIIRPKYDTKFSRPYVLCALCAIDVVLIEVAQDDDVYFIFDRQEGMRRQAIEELRTYLFDWFGADRRVKGIDFISRETTVCLDPADYLAYMIREREVNPNSFMSSAGKPICDANGNGGWIPAPYLEYLARAPHHSIDQAVRDMMQNPYFRGPI